MKRMTLKRARTRAGFSQLALARAARVDQTTISKLEIGKVVNPSFSTICRLAAALDIDPRVLKFGLEVDQVSA